MVLVAEGSFNILSVNPGLAIWTVVTFLLVLIVLWRFAWTPIVEALDARNEKVEADLKASEDLRKEAEELLKSYEEKITAAKHEVNELIETARKDGETMKSKIVSEAQAEANDVRNRAKHDIDQARVTAIKEIQELAVDISVKLVSDVMRNGASDEDHRNLVLKELEKLKSTN